MQKQIICFFTFILCLFSTPLVFANNVSIENLDYVSQDTESNTALLEFDISWENSWKQMILNNEVPCHSCNLLPVCAGSCPKDWLFNNAPCPSFKENIDDRLFMAANYQGNLVDLRKFYFPNRFG